MPRKKTERPYTEPPAPLLTTTTAGILLGVGPEIICALVRDGKLKASLVGRNYLIRRESIDAFLTEREGVLKGPALPKAA